LNDTNLETERKDVARVIDKWLDGWSRQDIDIILKYVAHDFVLQLPIENWSKINGKDELKKYVQKYYMKRPLGPVTHEESLIGISSSGDLAYEIGRHDHVVFNESGGQHIVPWNHLIVLKKILGEWKISAISETNVLSF
jgi:ketosteroid isomerase-like protein